MKLHISYLLSSSEKLPISYSYFPFLPMASPYLLLQFPLYTALFATIFASHPSIKASDMYPSSCSESRTCDALLYHKNYGLPLQNVSSFYSVNSSQIKAITHGSAQDYLISVPCSCTDLNGTRGYFYNTSYLVQLNDTFDGVSDTIYSGQVWHVGDNFTFVAGDTVPIYLLCGCVESNSQIVVTYTVQQHDTVSDIGALLSAQTDNILSMNSKLIQSSAFLDVGWVLFVPMDKNPPKAKHGRRHQWAIIVGVLSAVTFLSMILLAILLLRRRISKRKREVDLKLASKTMSSKKSFSLQNQHMYEENMEAFGSERPVIFPLEEIEEATNSFDETRKIGEGGYGCVYFGVLGGKEVAIKKMRSNKSKEFFAELKVLCKIHHINVVELLGFASGDDHLYLVYEYVQNGSLGDHLHDPLLKGHQPLSWTARTQIALDTAKGIEYIHDHTKSRYVHRDIKTSNILLDEGLRAKVADFGLVKLVGRSSDEDFFATRLVGTPGYLPPESVKELQVTPKTDVFAFGVVVAELITGQRALIRDNREPTKLRSLITVVNKIFQDANPEAALEAVIDPNLRGSYPIDDVYKMAEIADWCLSDDAVSRPEMQEVVVALCRITMSSTEWEASLGGSQVFSGVFKGR